VERGNSVTTIFVALEPELIARGFEYGELMVWGYATGRMTDRKVYAKADSDVRLQALSKMAECAFAIFARKSPDDLDWFGEHKNGEGHDLVVQKYLFDIKHTEDGRKLIWPVTKNDEFWTKDFNCLALVIGRPPVFEIAGIISKRRFDREKQVAEEGDGSGLFPGTWFMHRDKLSDPLCCLKKPTRLLRFKRIPFRYLLRRFF
jgi:hypothetical protein